MRDVKKKKKNARQFDELLFVFEINLLAVKVVLTHKANVNINTIFYFAIFELVKSDTIFVFNFEVFIEFFLRQQFESLRE